MTTANEINYSDKLVAAALQEITLGETFEELMKRLVFLEREGDFQPIGGMHDQGKDGIWCRKSTQEIFQFSIQKTWKAKIKNTIDRVRKSSGQSSISKVTFYFPFEIAPNESTQVINDYWEKEKINVQILSQTWVVALVNSTSDTKKVFSDFCEKYGVEKVIESKAIELFQSNGLDKVLVFLKHFIEDSVTKDYLEQLVFTHATLFLMDTDPEKGVFKTNDEVLASVQSQMPGLSLDVIKKAYANLQILNEKKHRDERDFRFYSDDRVCLSFKLRQRVVDYAATDALLKTNFTNELQEIFEADSNKPDGISAELFNDLVLSCLAEVFRKQGLNLVKLISGDIYNIKSDDLRGLVESRIVKSGLVAPAQQGKIANKVADSIYQIIWRPTVTQGGMLKSLAKTYSLMFLGKADPQVLQYLEGTAKGIVLILGTDIIVKILSEVWLSVERQRYTVLLKSLQSCGAKIHVTDGILREAGAHIRSTLRWYEEHVDLLLAHGSEPDSQVLIDYLEHNSSKILVRAYYYSKKDGKVSNFRDFLAKFVGRDVQRFHTDILEYLEGEFGIRKTEGTFDRKDTRFEEIKHSFIRVMRSDHSEHGQEIIARNDAETAMSIYALRAKETPASIHNFLLPERVWWLTAERKVEDLKKDFERLFTRPPHIHPLVILGLMSNLPALRGNQNQLTEVLAGALGLKMSRWVDDDLVTQISQSYQAITEMSAGKKRQYLGQLVDKLKSNKLKPVLNSYDHSFKALQEDQALMNELYQLRANKGPLPVWSKLQTIVKDPVARVVLFTEIFNGTRAEALKFLRENGFADDVKGMRAQFLDAIVSSS